MISSWTWHKMYYAYKLKETQVILCSQQHTLVKLFSAHTPLTEWPPDLLNVCGCPIKSIIYL